MILIHLIQFSRIQLMNFMESIQYLIKQMVVPLLPLFTLLNLNLSPLNSSLVPVNHTYNPSCIEYIEWIGSNLSSNMSKILERTRQQLQYSGTYYNSQGDYYKCINSIDRSYYILILDSGYKTVGQLFYALCLNNSCTGDDVKELVNNLDIILKVTEVIQPKTIADSMKIPWTSYLVMGVILGFITLTIIITTLHAIPAISTKMKDTSQLRFLNMFAFQNTRTVFNKSGDIKFLHGIKGFCFIIVVVAHQQIQIAKVAAILNIYSIYLVETSILTTIFLSYIYAIDVFLYIGGFLLGYYFPRRYLKQQSILVFFKSMLFRILRFLPMLVVTTFIYWMIMPILGSGPFFFNALKETKHCANGWWKDFMFVGNFYQMCMPWSWYIQVDVQLFLLSLILLWVYTRLNTKLSSLILHILIAGSIIYIAIICQKGEYKVWATMDYLISDKCQQYVKKVYYLPFNRISVYLFGLAIGIFYFQYHQYKEKSKQKQGAIKKYKIVKFTIKKLQSKANRTIITLLGFGIILFFMFIPYSIPDHEWDQAIHSAYLATARLFVVFGVFLITLPLMFGYSNPLQTILSAKLFQFISKISLSSYLFHNIYIIWRNISMPNSTYLTPYYLLIKSVMDLIPILIGGFILAVTIEFPLIAIIDFIFWRPKNRIRQNTGDTF